MTQYAIVSTGGLPARERERVGLYEPTLLVMDVVRVGHRRRKQLKRIPLVPGYGFLNLDELRADIEQGGDLYSRVLLNAGGDKPHYVTERTIEQLLSLNTARDPADLGPWSLIVGDRVTVLNSDAFEDVVFTIVDRDRGAFILAAHLVPFHVRAIPANLSLYSSPD